MAKEKKIAVSSLVSKWERAKPFNLYALVIGTAAYLSGVRDTPKSVIAALDRLGDPDSLKLGADVYEVLSFLRELDALDRLGAVTAPTLVVVGEQDLLTPPWIAREVADAIPGARFDVIRGDGSSHLVAIERPGDFNRRVSDFLAE